MNQVTYPLLTMIALPFFVIVQTLRLRISEMKKNKIHPQLLATRAESLQNLKNTNAADNLLNLFETPVLFYILSILFLIYKNSTLATNVIMWCYVASRYVHSYIQCTYNKVMHRFYAFLVSVILLLLLIINFVITF